MKIDTLLPKELHKTVEREIKKGKFASKKDFFKMLLRLWEEEKLLQVLEESEKEMKAGKGKLLRSLKDLR